MKTRNHRRPHLRKSRPAHVAVRGAGNGLAHRVRVFAACRIVLAAFLVASLVPLAAWGGEEDVVGVQPEASSVAETASPEAALPESDTQTEEASPDAAVDADQDEAAPALEGEAPVAEAFALAASHPTADVTVYVSSSGTDAVSGGTEENPYLTIAFAVAQASASGTTAVCVLDDLTAVTTADVGTKSIIVYGAPEEGETEAPVITGNTAVHLFTVTTGSLTFESITIDGASTMADHQVARMTDAGNITLGDGAVIQNWYSTSAYGALYVKGNNASLTMKSGSLIKDCSLVTTGSYNGGAAINITAARNSGTGTSPSATYRVSFTMESGSSITNCATQLTANASMSGGGAIHAADANLSIANGATIEGCSLTYRTTGGVLINPSTTWQGGGAIFANNCRIDMAGSMTDCTMVGQEDLTQNSLYAGGGAIFVYTNGCTTANGIDCRTTVSGTITGCSAMSGGGVFYWSINNGFGEGDNLWVGGSGPLQSAQEVVDKVNDTFILTGSATIEDCSTSDMNSTRSAPTLASYTQYEVYGIGGGAICGAYQGLVVLEDGSVIRDCATGTEGGGMSSYATALICTSNSADLSTGPLIENCTSKGIAGGLCTASSSSIEQIIVRGCSAIYQGGGLYLYSGSTTMYNCLVENCSAGIYGGGIMQQVVHDFFMYGGTVINNYASTSGGGIALNGHYAGSLTAPRGLIFNYPTTLNGGYTNPVYYKTSILQDKIVAPVVVAGNGQEVGSRRSNVWTSSSIPTARIAVSGAFQPGSKIGVAINNRVATSNQVGSQFANLSQPGIDLRPFASDVVPSLVPAYSGTNLVWQQGYVVDYDANWPPGETTSGSAPSDSIQGIQNAYLLTEQATVLGQGDMVGGDYAFLGWSLSASATAASYVGGSLIGHNATTDPDGNYRITLYAVWEQPEYVCQIIRDGALYRSYTTLYEALASVQSNDRIEMLKDAPLIDFNQVDGKKPPSGGLSVGFSSATGVVLTTAPASTPTVPGSAVWQGAPTTTPVAVLERTANGEGGASYLSLTGGAGMSVFGIVFDGRSTPAQTSSQTGINGNTALLEVSSAQLTLGSGTRVQNSYNANVIGLGGGVRVGAGASVTVEGGAQIRANATTGSGGGAYVDAGGSLVLRDCVITDNRSTATAVGYDGSWVGGVGNLSGDVTVSGNPVVSGNVGKFKTSSSGTLMPSDLETNNNYITVAVAGLGSGASIGITSSDDAHLQPEQQFAKAAGGSSAATGGASEFFNNDNASLHGIAGFGDAYVWEYGRSVVTFTKVGADQSTGLHQLLPGATFNLYRYVGATAINATSIADGSIDLATVDSSQWAPILDDAGTEGTPGDGGNVPYDFVSADGTGASPRGQVDLAGVQPGAWYMLVETEAPLGYQTPAGQWALQVHEVSAGTFAIDLSTILARPGEGGELPPAFATTVETDAGTLDGVLAVNVPVFNLPFAGTSALPPFVLLGIILIGCALALVLKHRKAT